MSEERNVLMRYKVAIIILNWNGWQDTLECLESLLKIKTGNFNITVVDNNSQDGSVEIIEQYIESKYNAKLTNIDSTDLSVRTISNDINIIKNDHNYGFAAGNNIAIRYILDYFQTEYILLLNNDIVVSEGFLPEMISVMDANGKIAFGGPKIYYYSYNGRKDIIDFAGGIVDMNRGLSYHIGFNEIDNGQYDKVTEVDYVEGSCIIIRAAVIRKIGPFQDRYFAYWEDADLCFRAKEAGYLSVYIPKAVIWHKVSAADRGGIKDYYLSRNRLMFMKSHASNFQFFCFLAYLVLFDLWFCSAGYIKHGKLSYLRNIFKGTLEGIYISVLRKNAYSGERQIH
jgi:GT2 family glycosyltransferase